MRTLYFDIDGTLLILDTEEPKSALAQGRFEQAVRLAGFEKLVCIGNFVGVVHTVQRSLPLYDGLGVLFALCAGVFEDEDWFRMQVELVSDPEHRATSVDLTTDWWYLDDLAESYFRSAERCDVFRAEKGHRILVPSPLGDGSDVLHWLASIKR